MQSNSLYDKAYIRFNEVKHLSIVLAEVENSIFRLSTAIKKTQKRANALDNVRFITAALDEKEREEFSRQKIIKNNKEAAGEV
jgi:V/A-type H+-transporting ATPase subunit D